MKTVTIIIGTRPEAIKLAPVVKSFLNSKTIEVRVVLTGQHQDMVIKIMELFEIPFHKKFNVMKKGQSLAELSSKILIEMEKEFFLNKPSFVVVQGDTTTAFVASFSMPLPLM